MQPDLGSPADQKIASLTLRVESKTFFLDLKENLRGKYVKICERGANRDKSTIVVPFAGLAWFEALINYFLEEDGTEQGQPVTKQLEVESKAFFFEKGENPRGKFLRISESGPGTRGRSSLIVPAGGGSCSAWGDLRDALGQLRSLCIQEEEFPAEAAPQLHELEQRALPSAVYPLLQAPSIDVTGPAQLVGPGPSAASIGETKTGSPVLRAGHKRFFFDFGNNQKGDFLRITETVGSERMSIIVPAAALEQFGLAIQKCISQQRANAGGDVV